jgi:hypothetical protein
MCLMLGTNRRTNIDFPLPVGPAIILVNGCIHGMKWLGSYPSRTPKKPDYWFSKYNRVLLHYSVSIAAAAATAAYIPQRRCISLSQRRRRRILLDQRFLGYLVEIPQWARRRDRKHSWSTIQHLEQLRSHPKGNHPLSILWRHFRSHHIR